MYSPDRSLHIVEGGAHGDQTIALQATGTVQDAIGSLAEENSTASRDSEYIHIKDQRTNEGECGLSQDTIAPMKRIFLQLRSTSKPINETEIVNKFFASHGSDLDKDNQYFIHCQPPDLKYFYIVIDMNYTRDSDPVLRALPHEVYNVHNDKDKLSVHRMGGRAHEKALAFTSIYRWGR